MNERIIRYASQFGSNSGAEHLLPADASEAARLPVWHRQFASSQPSDAMNTLASVFDASDPCQSAMIRLFNGFNARSIYIEDADDGESFYLVLEGHGMLFLQEPMPIAADASVFLKDAAGFFNAANGIRTGYELPDAIQLCGGFLSGNELRSNRRDDDFAPWGDPILDGNLPFFQEMNGDLLAIDSEGQIRKWCHETSTLSKCFDSLLSFADSFADHFTQKR